MSISSNCQNAFFIHMNTFIICRLCMKQIFIYELIEYKKIIDSLQNVINLVVGRNFFNGALFSLPWQISKCSVIDKLHLSHQQVHFGHILLNIKLKVMNDIVRNFFKKFIPLMSKNKTTEVQTFPFWFFYEYFSSLICNIISFYLFLCY